MFCGIDVSKNKSQVCLLDDDKNIIKEFEIEHTKEGFDELEKNITTDTTIAMETTGNYSKAIYDYFKRRYKVIYVDNLQMHTFAKLHFSHMKNDEVDARLIAKYLSFGLRQVNPIRSDELRDLSQLYFKTIAQMSKYKHMFKGQMNVIFPELENHFHLTKAKAITTLLMEYPSPEQIAKLSNEEIYSVLTSKFKKFGVLRDKERFVSTIKELAGKSIGIQQYPTACLQYTIKILKFYEETMIEIKSKIKQSIMNSPYSRLLNDFGYGDINLSLIVGEIGDIRRFGNAKKLVKYCGFDVSENQSGKSESKNCYISKRGNKILRNTFYQMVQVYLSHNKEGHHAQFFNRLRKRGKHPKQAMTATARKLAVKCYWDMLKCHAEVV